MGLPTGTLSEALMMSSLPAGSLGSMPNGSPPASLIRWRSVWPNLPSGSGIAEAPGELLGHHLDGDGVGRRFVEVHARPDLGAHHHQAQKQDRRGAGPEGFELVVAVGIAGAAAVVAELDDHPAEGELRQEEDDPDDDQGAHELRVIRQAVRVDRRRKPPGLGDEEINDDNRQYPNDGSKQHSGPPGRKNVSSTELEKKLTYAEREVQVCLGILGIQVGGPAGERVTDGSEAEA